MFDNYEDYLYSSSKADELIEEMKQELHELITDEAKEIMEVYRKAENELDELSRQVGRERVILNNLQEELKELEGKKIKAEKYDMPRKYIDAFVREYTGYFAPGAKVFIIRNKSERVECDKCQGKKEIKAIIDGVENTIKCIKCNGYGAVSKTNKVIEERTIDKVILKLAFLKDKVSPWTSDCVFVRGSEYAVDPKDIFKTYEDAEKSMKEIE